MERLQLLNDVAVRQFPETQDLPCMVTPVQVCVDAEHISRAEGAPHDDLLHRQTETLRGATELGELLLRDEVHEAGVRAAE